MPLVLLAILYVGTYTAATTCDRVSTAAVTSRQSICKTIDEARLQRHPTIREVLWHTGNVTRGSNTILTTWNLPILDSYTLRASSNTVGTVGAPSMASNTDGVKCPPACCRSRETSQTSL